MQSSELSREPLQWRVVSWESEWSRYFDLRAVLSDFPVHLETTMMYFDCACSVDVAFVTNSSQGTTYPLAQCQKARGTPS